MSYKDLLGELDNIHEFPNGLVETNQPYRRTDDMGNGYISLFLQPDGDIGVSIRGRDGFGNATTSAVEFCMPMSGGGASPLTRKALLLLACAIAEENTRPNIAGGRAEQL